MERANIIDYIFNKDNNTIKISNNNKINIDPNNNQENYLVKEIAITRSKLCGDGSNTTGGTRSILIAGILTESEYARTVNTNTHTNNEIAQVLDAIDIYIESDEG